MGDKKSYDIRAIFEKMELELIKSMNRAFYYHKREENKEGFEWEQWQLSKLRAIEQYRRKNKKIVDSYAGPIQQAIDYELKGNFEKGQSRVSKLMDKIRNLLKINKSNKVQFPSDISKQTKIEGIRSTIAKAMGRPFTPPPDESFFGVNEKKLEALQQSVENDLKKAQQAVLRKMDDVYRQTIFKSHVYMQSGTKTLYQAIDMATKDFLSQGINCIEYKNGNRVNIASYAEMALRTASQRATFLGEGSKRDEYGIHLVIVSAHANTCEKCMPWQGKILIDDVFSHPSKEYIEEYSNKYKLLSEAIAAGLLHPNCRHTLITYFEGITQIPTIPDGKEAIKTYEEEQKQRALERQIRKWKRIEAGSVDEKNRINAANKVRNLENTLKQHIRSNHNLRINHNRVMVKEFDENKHKENLKLYDTSIKIKRDGATRAREFEQYWQEASLRETLDKLLHEYDITENTAKGKVIYSNKESNIQIVYDKNGDYFRIEDLSIKGKRRYLSINGENVSNKSENGKQKGRTKEEYEALTHFKNKDGDS